MKSFLSKLNLILLALLATSAAAETVDCTIQPSLRVDVTSSVDGILEEILVRPGDRVEKGQVLARLQSDVERTSLEIAKARAGNFAARESAESRHEFYLSRLNRARELIDRQIIPFEELERAQTEFIIAENDLESALTDLKFAELEVLRTKALLELKTVRSPFDGILVQHYLDPGAFVGEQAAILELAKLDPLKVRAFVPVHLHPTVQSMSLTTVWPQAPFDGAKTAEITLVESVFDIASGTFGVDLLIGNPDYSLPAGIKCKVDFKSTN